MGYMRHHAIIVTSSDDRLLNAAHAESIRLGAAVSGVICSPINGYRSFLIAPDGSKEGWSQSDEGDTQRAAWIAWADDQRYSDGTSSLDWVEIQFADDEGDTRRTADSSHRKHVPLRPATPEETR
jgi:hypothetical protein